MLEGWKLYNQKNCGLVSSRSTGRDFFVYGGASKDFHCLSRSHQLSKPSESKAMRTADPLRTVQFSEDFSVKIHPFWSYELSPIRYCRASQGSRCIPSLFTDGHFLRHKVTEFRVKHSTSRKYNKACWRMAEDRWLRGYCCLFSVFRLIFVWSNEAFHGV